MSYMNKALRFDIPELASAHAWDRRINTLDNLSGTLETLEPFLSSPLHARRYVQAALATCCPATIQCAVDSVVAYGHQGLEGVLNKVLVQQGRYAEVIEGRRALVGSSDPWDIENMLDDEVAQASACVELGEMSRAQAHLHGARLLAQLLNMPYQLQWCMLESGRLRLTQGNPDSDLMREALAVIVPSARREQWGNLTLAESLYSEGDGEAAWLIAKDLDPIESEGFAFLLARYLDYEVGEYEASLPGIYADIARATTTPLNLEQIDALPIPTNEPAKTIVRSLKLTALATNPANALQARAQAEQLLKENPSPFDRVMLLTLLISVGVRTHASWLPGVLSDLAQSLNALRVKTYALNALSRHTPLTLALLAYSPYSPKCMSEVEPTLPLIVGQHLRVDDTMHSLPGKSQGGVQLVRQGFFGDSVRLHHAARKRIEEAAKSCGHPKAVNIGILLKSMLLVTQQAAPEERDAWKESAIRLLELVDSIPLKSEIQQSELYIQSMKM